jgi:hypothetical protein
MPRCICDTLPKITGQGASLFRSISIGISRAITSTIFLVLALLFFTQPNYYRAFAPQFFGLNKIAPNIYSDQRLQLNAIQRAIKAADQNAAKFFPNQTANPTYIVCFKQDCEAIFGGLPSGLTLGYHRVIISPRGFDQRIFNHERIHIDLHSLMNVTDVFKIRYPTWFNEGLAELLSGSNCQGVPPSVSEIERIKTVVSLIQWNVAVSDRQYRRHYGAACRAVEQIRNKIGSKKLSELVHNATSRDQFLASIGE